MTNIIEGINQECDRVSELIKLYEETPEGKIAASMMKQSVVNAIAAIGSGDVVEMIRCLQDLKEYEE